MKAVSVVILTFLIAALFPACNHKELVYPGDAMAEVTVRFDWLDAPGASPEGMIVYFYPADPGATEIYRFEIQGHEGGFARVPTGRYNILAYNSDATDVLFGGLDSFDGSYQYAPYSYVGYNLKGSVFASSNRITEVNGEIVRRTPSMVYRAAGENIIVEECCCDGKNGQRQLITLYPQETCDYYNYTVRNIENQDNALYLAASLSGMGTAEYLVTRTTSPDSCTVALDAAISETSSVTDSFLCYGNAPKSGTKNILTLYAVMKDGKLLKFNYDVTSQILAAPDPHHVAIVIDNLKLPEVDPDNIIGGGSQGNGDGIIVAVDGWIEINVDLST